MLIDPDVHLEIARQRHEHLLAEAERHRMANVSTRLHRQRLADPALKGGRSRRAVRDSPCAGSASSTVANYPEAV
jgi:hypothetical protein